eukprot:TRINITY_DN104039_c0_g1_i1.p1 TRINITY_DN104039_c0_g1~~TRINITY_DN104039_c0_g1_i1.p1  ORF type:complete len:680 (+),score=60.59 TRINITY_DN104039_c0_g1_i1:48-2087(+)
MDHSISARLPPHLIAGTLPCERPDYIVVIPSFNRPTQLRDKTFDVILRQRVPLERVFVFVAGVTVEGQTQSESQRYLGVLVPKGLPADHVVTGVKGILQQRNYIVDWVLSRFGDLTHVVSMDDDLDELLYKVPTRIDRRGGEVGVLRPLEVGGLDAWIAHASKAMLKYNCYIWSLNTSANPYYMRSDTIGTGNGMINGYFYGFRVRANTPELLPQFKSASEDRERSVRYFAKDGILLRYKMYAAKTKPFHNAGGIQDEYEGSLDLRKADEREGHRMIEAAFPLLYTSKSRQERRTVQTMEGGFKRMDSSESIVQNGLRSDLQPRTRGEGRRQGQADDVPADSSLVATGRDTTGTDEQRVVSEAVHSQARGSRSLRSEDHKRYIEVYRSVHPPLKEAPDGWEIERREGPSGCRYTKYTKNGKTCYSLKQIEAYLGCEISRTAGQLQTSAGSDQEERGEGETRNDPDGVAGNLLASSSRMSSEADFDGEWDCCTCTFRNPPDVDACVICRGARPGEGAWFCSTCNCENTEVTLVCIACCVARPDPAAWLCLRCEAHSPPDENSCVACGLHIDLNCEGKFRHYVDSDSDREDPEEQPEVATTHDAAAPQTTGAEASAGLQTCVRCTFDNPADVFACKMCDAPLTDEESSRKRARHGVPALTDCRTNAASSSCNLPIMIEDSQ